ncbi:MAG TPA: AMP-binding protein [Gammaproteobacteria bacterium]|nr:AMP-binding protein [Gammaproteobacteria bacterium]
MQSFHKNSPEFKSRVNAWRSLLQRTHGQNFALVSHNSLEFTSALVGSWLAGKTIVLPSNILPDSCEAIRKHIDGYLGEFPENYSPLNPTKEDENNFFTETDITLQDYIGLVIYTSGSTGEPQAITKKLSQLSREIITLEKAFGPIIPKTAEMISTVSHEHFYGLLFKILWPLTTGRAIYTRNILFLEELAQLPTVQNRVLISSPAHLKRTKSLHNIHTVFSSAGPLLFETAQQIKKLSDKAPIEIYGSSETGAIAWRQRDEINNESWQPLPGITWRIAENNLLELCSPHLINTKWYRTSDHISTANNNTFLLLGRADRIVKLEGKRISLDAIEKSLMQSSLISDVRTVMSEHSQRQTIMAFIVLSAKGKKLLNTMGKLYINKKLRENLIHSIEPIAHPRAWRYLDALPVNAQGKTTCAELIQPIFPHHCLIEKDAQRAVYELTPPTSLLYFEGHFPNTPILPGVVQVHWAIHYGRQCFELPKTFRQISKLKFQKVIQPNTPITLELMHERTKNQLNFVYYSSIGQHASGSIYFD